MDQLYMTAGDTYNIGPNINDNLKVDHKVDIIKSYLYNNLIHYYEIKDEDDINFLFDKYLHKSFNKKEVITSNIVLLYLGIFCKIRGDYVNMKHYWNSVKSDDDVYSYCMYEYGKYYQEKGVNSKMKKYLLKSIECKYIEAFCFLAEHYLIKKKYKKMINYLKYPLDQGHEQAHYIMGRYFEIKGNVKQMLFHYEQSNTINSYRGLIFYYKSVNAYDLMFKYYSIAHDNYVPLTHVFLDMIYITILKTIGNYYKEINDFESMVKLSLIHI